DPAPYIFSVGSSSDSIKFSGTLDLRPPNNRLPDLQIANVMTVPRFPVKGDKVIFLATVINRGVWPSPAATFHEISFKVDGQYVCSSVALEDSISKGGMALVCGNVNENNGDYFWTAGDPGTHTIEAVVNPTNNIPETIFTNNTKTASFRVYDAPPVNLALRKTVTVSSIENNNSDYVGSKAVDGNNGTRWSSAWSDIQWIAIDFGSVTTFNRIKLNWEAAYGKQYRIEVSNDNSNWTTLLTQTNGQGGIEQYNVSASARYLRIYGTKRGTQYGYSLYEIEVYNLTTPTSVNEKETELPFSFKLSNNYPNPFNPSTTINYEIPRASNVRIEIFNSLGQLVKVLTDSFHQAGKYSSIWNGDDSSGSLVASGVYFYRMSAEGFTLVKKMVLMK
ncbi:MAG: discoidin domain-containing protein, partial [Bacteroidetes bacterium]|nr:discoidin domain-containing protein [Bacteroidota bacterium]